MITNIKKTLISMFLIIVFAICNIEFINVSAEEQKIDVLPAK